MSVPIEGNAKIGKTEYVHDPKHSFVVESKGQAGSRPDAIRKREY